MKPILENIRVSVITVAAITTFLIALPNLGAVAQTSTATMSTVSETTIKALQEALNKQGIAVGVTGVLDEETRASIRKYQSQHHVPVTGDPDKATLDKLGVRQSSTTPTESPVLTQTPSTSPSASSPAQAGTASSPGQTGQMANGMMMGCHMMHAQMQSMMQMMQSMMQMMEAQKPGQMQQPRQMHPG